MIAQQITSGAGHKTARRFYRPELDALRFFAFLGVLVCHGPRPRGFPDFVSRFGGFGLSMFFLLSAYLITELLLREREQSGRVDWGLFLSAERCGYGRSILPHLPWALSWPEFYLIASRSPDPG